MHIQIQIFAGTLNDKKSNFKTHYIKGYKSYFIVFQKKKKKKKRKNIKKKKKKKKKQ